MRSISPKLKKIFTGILMLVVLANSGFLPIFGNVGFGFGTKAVEAQTDQEITKATQAFLKTRTGRQPDGTYNGGIYREVLEKTKDETAARQAADTAEINLSQTARAYVIAEKNKDKDAAAAAEFRYQTVQLKQELADEKYKNGIISAEVRDQEYNAADLTYTELETGTMTPEQRAAAVAAANKENQDRANAINQTGGGNSEPEKAEPIKCNLLDGALGTKGNIESCFAIISYNLLKISALFLSLVGALFNVTLDFTLNIGKHIPQSAPGALGLGGTAGAIYVGWSTIRDFINVAFIFVLLFAAISIILQTDKYGIQKIITKVVIAALLLNFSLFFTKVIVDLSNILALQFYSRILDASAKAGGNPGSIDSGLSAGLLNQIGLQKIWTGTPKGTNATAAEFGAGITPYQLISVSIFGSIFILVFSFVLFMATIQFVLRTIVLIFLMITSPIGFIGGAIPGLDKQSGEWWSRLKNNAVFAPAYMAVMYVSCLMIFGGAANSITGGSNIKELITGSNPAGAIGIAFWFAIVIGFLITAQLAARGFADKFGSSFSGKAEKWFKSAPLLRYTGATALARIGLGNSARALSENRIAKRVLNAPIIKQLGGQKTYNAIKDLQEVKVGGKSYKDVVDARVKRDTKTFERLGETTVRKGMFESDDNFKKRQTYADNATTRAQARFMGLSVNDTNIKEEDVKGADGKPIQKRKNIFWKENIKEQKLSDAAFKQYKTDTSETAGAGYRKARKEVGKKANTGTKGTVLDIEKQIEKAEKAVKDSKAYHDAEVSATEAHLKDARITNPDPAIHQANLADPANPTYRRNWFNANKNYEKAVAERDKKQEKLDELYRKLRVAQNAGKEDKK